MVVLVSVTQNNLMFGYTAADQCTLGVYFTFLDDLLPHTIKSDI